MSSFLLRNGPRIRPWIRSGKRLISRRPSILLLNSVLLFCILVLILVIYFKEIHDVSKEEQVRSILKTAHDSHHSVIPSTGTVQFYDIEEDLYPAEGILAGIHVPIYIAYSDSSKPLGIDYKKISEKNISATIYKNLKTKTSLKVREDDSLDGTVHSSPDPMMKKTMSKKSKNVVHETKESLNPKPGKENATNSEETDLPEIVYPEILVMVDHGLALALGKSTDKIVEYVITFWNAVNLRYRRLENPKIRLNIAGIIIAQDSNAFSFLPNSIVRQQQVDTDKALFLMGRYFFLEKRFAFTDDYDIAVTMTTWDLASCDEKSSKPQEFRWCNPSTMGLSYVEGGCVESVLENNRSHIESIAIVEDDGFFLGVIPTAHELGHIFGANHDEEDGCYGGNIMATAYNPGEESYFWSKCSLTTFSKYFSSLRKECLLNMPKNQNEYRRLLPGQFMPLDDQCVKRFGPGSKPCKIDERVCFNLQCKESGKKGRCVRTHIAAFEGSSCGKGKICFEGKCQSLKSLKSLDVMNKLKRIEPVE